ncbi:MAG: CheR family methyltransferase [Polyangia bacterium]
MSAHTELAEPAHKPLCHLIEERVGLRFDDRNTDILRHGLQRLGLDGAATLRGLHAELATQPVSRPVWQRLLAEIAVGETYFFRHPEDFAVLERRIVPSLLGSGVRTLRACSVGCSTGEEAYSLAVALSAAAPLGPIEVLGTDINQAALAVADKGVYRGRSLRGVAPIWEAMLPQGPDGEHRVPAELRGRVRFLPLNLAEPGASSLLGEGSFQVIFCRNVLVYFGAARAAQVLAQLARSLGPGGALFVSPLDLTHRVPGLVPLELDGVWLFSKAPAEAAPPRRTASGAMPVLATAPAARPSSPTLYPDPVTAARAAADRGDLAAAAQIGRQAVRGRRTPETLHLLALILSEQGQLDESQRLLEEALALCPTYVLGHLSLGLLPLRGRREHHAPHLERVLSLLEQRADDEILEGPERLRVALARRLAQQGLRDLQAEAAAGRQPISRGGRTWP